MSRTILGLIDYKEYKPDNIVSILGALAPYVGHRSISESELVALIEQAEFLDGLPGFSSEEVAIFRAVMGHTYETCNYETFQVALNKKYHTDVANKRRDDAPTAYPYGEVVFLIGNLDTEWARIEYAKFAPVAEWLAKTGFKTVVHLSANDAHVREAASNPNTRCIIWSSHGYSDGIMKGADGKPISFDSFENGEDSRLKQIVLSACNGEEVSSRYSVSAGVDCVTWKGKTNTKDLFEYLLGCHWNPS